MILYGSKAKHLSTKMLQFRCKSCGQVDKVQLSVYQPYIHLLKVPLFPTKKIGIALCTQCGHITDNSNFNADLSTGFNRIKSIISTPIWTFAGAFLIVLFVSATVVYESIQSTTADKHIKSNRKENVYKFKNKDGSYSLYSIDRNAADTVYVLVSKNAPIFDVNMDVSSSERNAGYTLQAYPILHSSLRTIYAD